MSTLSVKSQCLSGYNFFKKLTIQSSKVPTDQNNFPILIQHTDPDLMHTSFTGDVENINGFDIAFTAADGNTLLNHQIENYDPLTGKITYWVNVPLISGSIDTEIYLYYGNNSIITDPSTSAVWDANHKAVYHFESVGTIGNDATSNGVNLANNGVNNFVGVADDGANFDAGDNLTGNPGSAANVTGDLTITTWIKLHTLQTSNYENVLLTCGAIGEAEVENKAYYFSIDPDWKLRMLWEYGILALDATYVSNASITPSLNVWTQLTVTRNSSNNKLKFFQNGVQIGTDITYLFDATGGGDSFLTIAQNQQFTNYDLDGEQDAIRISNVVRDDDWILTEYNSISDPSTFYTIGIESPTSGSLSYSSTAFCVTESNPSPTIYGATGGAFSSTSGLNINTTSGLINLSASTPGSYSVTYTSQNNCLNTFGVTINPEPSISCRPNDTVTANSSCNYILGDYTSDILNTLVDGCVTGSMTVTQNPIPGTLLPLGNVTIELTAEDGLGNVVVCDFTLVVKDLINPTLANCGDQFIGETTIGNGNATNTYSCSGINANGEDRFYQIDVPVGNYQIYVTLENVIDAQPYTELFWIGSTCPTSGGCVAQHRFKNSTQKFDTNGSNTIQLNATGPGTYFVSIDQQGNGIDSYDISFNCIKSGIEFDESGCTGDTDNDGIIAEVDGTSDLSLASCETVTICHDIYVANVLNSEWLDSVSISLGNCYDYSTISNVTPINGGAGFENVAGVWNHTVDGTNGIIEFDFTNSNNASWGDGSGNAYTCATDEHMYTFCFDVSLNQTCVSDTGVAVAFYISDDGVPSSGGSTVIGADAVISEDFTFTETAAPTLSYSSSSFCSTASDPSPTYSPLLGTFNGNGATISATGVIDLSATTSGTYTIEYTEPGPCGRMTTFGVTVVDASIPPVADLASLPNITSQCSVAAPTAPTATDNCDGAITGTTTTTFPITSQGTTVVTWTYTDGGGNSSTQTQNVIVDDVTAPVADAGSLSNLTGQCSVAAPTAPTATDNCDGAITGTTTTTFPVTTQGTTVVTWTFTDGEGNASTQNQNVIIDDVTAPIPNAGSLSNLTGECSVSAPTAPTATDNCDGIITGTTATTFPITSQGTTVVTWTYTDGDGNTSTQTQNVIIDDVSAPILDAGSLPNLTNECSVAAPIAPTATDNCDGTITGTTTNSFPITSQGTSVVTWTFTDLEGNTSTQTQNVIIDDVTAPAITCGGNITENSDATCQFTLLDYTGNITALSDNCGGTPTVTQSPIVGTVITGTTTIMLTANDGNGNTSTCTFDVLLDDNTAPTMACKNISVYIDGTGDATIAASDLDNGSTDNCGTVNFTASQTVFDCSHLGANNITLTGTDANSNSATCVSTVTIIDTIKPIPNVVSLPVLTAECTLTAIAPTATDNCGGTITATTTDPLVYSTQGTFSITWTYTDASGNFRTQTQSVTIDDITAPTLTCGGNITENPNASCQFTLLDYTGNTTILSDNCGGTPTVTQSPIVGTVITTNTTITLTANDGNGNTSTCSFDVLLVDNTAPTMVCQNISIYLDGTGDATILASELDNGSTDNCGTVNFSASQTVFDCSHLGTNSITLTGTDANSNSANCASTVTIIDTIRPIPDVASLPTLTAECSLTATPPTATDNCSGTITATTSDPLTYSSQGLFTITWTYTDASGNSISQTQSVIIDDITAPAITCGGNITENPDAACQFTLVDYTGNTAILTDNCGGTPTVTQSPIVGTVITGTTTITLTANDGNGNTSTCTFDVLLDDNTAPTMACKNISVYIDGTGDATILASELDNGSTDNCGTVNFSASQTVFDCSDLGASSITLTGTDANSNSANCASTVTIIDTIRPIPDVASLPTLTAECSLTATPPTATDNCGGTISATTTDPLVYSTQGTFSITWTYTDASGNFRTQTQSVTIDDITAPTLTCGGNITESPDASCQFTLVDYTGNTTILSDNCGGTPTVTQSPIVGTVITTNTTVTLTANDGNGNTSTCSFDVLLVDNTAPTMVCQNISIYLDGSGDATILASELDNGSTDNCGTVNFTASQTVFDCSDLGTNSITLTGTDANSNSASCVSTVTVFDTIRPTIICVSNILSCDSIFTFNITGNDNCSNVTINQITGLVSGSTFPIGTTINTFEAIDGSGNRDTCFFSIERLVKMDASWNTLVPEACVNSTMIDLNTLVNGTTGGDFTGPGIVNNTFNPSLAGPGIHSINYHVENVACVDDSAQQIIIYDISTINAGLDDSICQLSYAMNGSSNLQGNWQSLSGNVTFDNPTDTITEATSITFGDETIIWTVLSPSSCIYSDTVVIQFDEQPIANAGLDTIIYQNFNTFLEATPSSGNGYWELTNGDGTIDNYYDPSSLFTANQPGVNELTWIEENGSCLVSYDDVIVTFKYLLIPEGMSPNNDGYNDYFLIKGLGQFEQVQIVIFDRWGKLVYENTNYQNDWNGEHLNGSILNNDTYFYEINVDGLNFKGFVVIKI